MRIAFAMCFLSVLILLGGCRRYEGSDKTEQEHPVMKRAQELVNQQDLPGAIALCKELLREKPQFARAHLQLGFMYQTQNDHVRAIYHYSEYLALRPDSSKRDVVEQMIADERSRLSEGGPVKIPDVPPDVAEVLGKNESLQRQLDETERQLASTRLELEQANVHLERAGNTTEQSADLARENQRLRTELSSLTREHEELRQTLNTVLARMENEQTNRPVTPTPTPPPSGGRQYVVQSGDSLTRIATKMYDDPAAWKQIYNANKHILTREDRLRVGQTLIIP